MADTTMTTLPQNVEAERSILGSILLDKNALIRIGDIITKDDFYQEKHKVIFEAIITLFQRHQEIDTLTLSNYLEEKKLLSDIGGASYLSELIESVPTATHAEEYAKIIKDKATLRNLILAGHAISALGMKEEENIAEVLEKAEKEVFSVSQTFLKEKFIHIKDVLDTSYERIAELYEKEDDEALRGVPTNFYDLDKKLSGLQPSDLIILAARPSMGKTALALNIAQNVAEKGYTVGIFSLEMSKDQLVERLFCSMLEVNSWHLRTGRLEAKDFGKLGKVMDQLANMKLFIDDSAGCNIIELRAKARRLQAEHGMDLLIVDYLQLMSSSTGGGNFGNRVQEISEISRSLKILARELNVPIIALSQLSRAVEMRTDKIPQLSDLRESGSIEQDADVVLFLYREDYYSGDSGKEGLTDLIIAKHRTGPTGRIQLGFKKEQIRFVNLEKHRTAEEYQIEEGM